MILDTMVKTKWCPKNRNHYVGLGYTYTKMNDEFEVHSIHLIRSSETVVEVICDKCQETLHIRFKDYYQSNDGGKYYCEACSIDMGYRKRFRKDVIKNERLSFKEWALQNNKGLLERWDFELNKCSPDDVSSLVNQSYYFKCPMGKHVSELKNIRSTVIYNRHGNCNGCNSFAQYLLDVFGYDALELYWGKSNIVSPWDIGYRHEKLVLLNCLDVDYHGEYPIRPKDFVEKGVRCGFCGNHKTHPNDSFAHYNINKYGETFLDKYWDYKKNNELKINPYEIAPFSSKAIWIYCQDVNYHGSYPVKASSFSLGFSCKYCSGKMIHPMDSLGSKCKDVINIWSKNNNKTAFEYSEKSGAKVWWKCTEGKHADYFRSINVSAMCDFRCPECVRERRESFLQEKVRKYIANEYNYSLLHEDKCTIVPINPITKKKMPYDNEVAELKLICEVQGLQHYVIEGYNRQIAKRDGLSKENVLQKRKEYDKYKKEYALSNGYFFLDIPCWTERDESYKTLIDNKIHEILTLSMRNKEA